MSVNQTYQMLCEEAGDSQKRRRHPDQVGPNDKPADDLDLSVNTAKKYKSEMNIRDRVPQGLSAARAAACACIRLVYIYAMVVETVCQYLSPYYKWNFDATTLVVTCSGDGMKVCVFRETGDPHKQVTTTTGGSANGELALLVKSMCLGNAGGEIGTTMFMYALPTMADDKFFTCEVRGLSNSSSIGAKGRVYIAQTRGGTPAMWRHMFTEVILKDIKASADVHQEKVISIMII
jgi:hypothetical protein